MSKIKNIQERLHKDIAQYNLLSFLIARRIFLGIAALFFTVFLFTIGGFYFWIFSFEVLSMLTFHIFSILVVAFVWFSFSFAEYMTDIYFPTKRWLAYVVLGLSIIFGGVTLYAHIFVPNIII